jgi:hypothetical protein
MTREQVIELAKQAGLFPSELGALSSRHLEMLRLAREDMREQCAKVCELKVCGSQGFAGPSCCILPPGHEGEHKYGVPMAKTQRQCAEAIRNLEV